MTEPVTVTLGGREFSVAPHPFRVMRKLQPAVNRALRDMVAIQDSCDVAEEQLQHLQDTVALGLGVPSDELGELTFTPDDAYRALMAIYNVNQLAGLSPNGLAAVKAAVSSAGTTSTPPSPLAPAGAGLTSTT